MKRTKGPAPHVAPGAEPWTDKSLAPLWMDTRAFPAVAERAARAMQIGGATLDDIRTVYEVLRAQSVMHPLNVENRAVAARHRRQIRDLVPRRAKARKSIKRKGDKSRKFVADRYRYWRTTRRLHEGDIPAKIAAESPGNAGRKDEGLAIGTIKNYIWKLQSAGRIERTNLPRKMRAPRKARGSKARKPL